MFCFSRGMMGVSAKDAIRNVCLRGNCSFFERSLLGCEPVSPTEQFPAFRRVTLTLSSGLVTMNVRNVGKYETNDTASYPKRLVSSKATLSEPHGFEMLSFVRI